jgi:hypothetical protein
MAPDGRYTVRLFDNNRGQMCDVILDEFIPCQPDQQNQPMFVSSNGTGMWCMLLEKAVAKVFGSYDNLDGGFSVWAFRAFTGETDAFRWAKQQGMWGKEMLVTDEFEPSPQQLSQTELFNTLKRYSDQQYLMCAEILDRGDGTLANGLGERHAYSLLKVEEVDGNQLLLLRNPWGWKAWNGRWADGDSAWQNCPDCLRVLRPRFADNGLFWIDFEDFAQIFDNVEVCCRSMPRQLQGIPPKPQRKGKRSLSASAVPSAAAERSGDQKKGQRSPSTAEGKGKAATTEGKAKKMARRA